MSIFLGGQLLAGVAKNTISNAHTLFDFKWTDHSISSMEWTRADEFSWQSGAVYVAAYNHLVADLGTIEEETLYAWDVGGGIGETIFTKSETPSIGDNVYNYDRDTIIGSVESYDAEYQTIVSTAYSNECPRDSYSDISIQSDTTSSGAVRKTETIGSYTITYWLATDGHKICLPDQETTALNIYNESGVAWYYIIDTANQRFKLPRENPAREELIQVIRAKGNGMTLGMTDGTNYAGLLSNASDVMEERKSAYGINVGASTTDNPNLTDYVGLGVTTDPAKSGIVSSMTDSTSVYKGKKYLYFYVGQFSQTAIEQTAGLNSELFNGKADVDLSNAAPNASASAKETIVGWGLPDYSAGIVYSSSFTAPSNGYCKARGSVTAWGTLQLISDGKIVDECHNNTGSTEILRIVRGFVKKGSVINLGGYTRFDNIVFYPLIGG